MGRYGSPKSVQPSASIHRSDGMLPDCRRVCWACRYVFYSAKQGLREALRDPEIRQQFIKDFKGKTDELDSLRELIGDKEVDELQAEIEANK
jgi:hypothetical protein